MRHDLEVSASVDIKADLAKVWNVMTNPKIIKEYLFGTETITNWKVGSEIVFQGEYEGHKYKDKGIVRENILQKRISYNYWSAFTGLDDIPENYSLVSYDLEKKGDKLTKLTWTQKGYATEQGHIESKGGMKEFLDHIKEIAER
jgi:uncharacterized protein YndB with AHSA1/START domain